LWTDGAIFIGPEVGAQYLDLMNGSHNWEDIVKRYHFELALIPAEWPLAQLMMRHPDWQVLIWIDKLFFGTSRRKRTKPNTRFHERIHRGFRQ